MPRHPKSSSAARGLLREFLGSVVDGNLFAEVGGLVLTELVNNAVQHARTPRDRLIFLRFEMEPGLLRIEVHDACGELPAVRWAGADDESGRGLRLVEHLSQAWGLSPRAGVGKAVWALIAPLDGGTT